MTDTAKDDLAEIWSFIATDDRAAADRFVAAIAARFEPLLTHPEIGPRREALLPGLRVHFHRDYAIYYRFSETAIVIVRVLHGARDARALVTGGDE